MMDRETGIGRLILWLAVIGGGLISGKAAANEPATEAGAQAFWKSHVESVLAQHCVKCHGGAKQKGGLDLRTMDAALKGGDSGSIVTPGDAEKSALFKLIQVGAEDHMPPDEGKQLKAEEIAVLKAWIEKLPSRGAAVPGAKWEGRPATPLVELRGKWMPPENVTAYGVIDYLLEEGWRKSKVQPSTQADDRTFVRRVYLDLIGRIPTVEEIESYLGPSDEKKREALVDRLLASDEHAQHFAEIFDVVLVGRQAAGGGQRRRRGGGGASEQGLREKWLEYLNDVFEKNRPWNEVVHEMILARPAGPADAGATYFLFSRNNNYQAMAEAVAPLAFGVQINCAQCHNHPLVAEIEQRHYWGLVAAFNRGKNVETEAGPGIAESAIGGFVNFTNLQKESQPAVLALLTNKMIDEARPAADAKEEDSADKYIVPPAKERPKQAAVPKFSRRAKLAEALTKENPLLARATVNRFWALLMGRGLVHPADQMDSKHLASHPELLDWLSDDFEKHGYDVRRLVKMIVMTRAYGLGSRPAGSNAALPETFASAHEKPLTAEMLWRSLLVAGGEWNVKPDEGKAKYDGEPLKRALVTAFPEMFVAEYNASLQQAMFLTNNPLLDELLKSREGNTTAKLAQIVDPAERVRKAFEIVLGRPPSGEESEQSTRYLAERSDRPEAAVRQLLWAMMSSAEFLMNH